MHKYARYVHTGQAIVVELTNALPISGGPKGPSVCIGLLARLRAIKVYEVLGPHLQFHRKPQAMAYRRVLKGE